RELWTICTDLAEEGEPPAFERVLTRIDCPDLKSLAVWIDEQAQLRDVAGKLSAEPGDKSPGLLNQVQEQMKRRRDHSVRESLRLDLAPHTNEELTDEVGAKLMQSRLMIQRRMTKKQL